LRDFGVIIIKFELTGKIFWVVTCGDLTRGLFMVWTPKENIIKKISGHQQRWPRPLPRAILIPPALLVVADFDRSGDDFFDDLTISG
jgi:hypothetical protein